MRRAQELNDPKSCLNRGVDNELMFVLLGRDIAAPFAIQSWASQRVETGKNQWNDPQIVEALIIAKKMDEERPTLDLTPKDPGGYLQMGTNAAEADLALHSSSIFDDLDTAGQLRVVKIRFKAAMDCVNNRWEEWGDRGIAAKELFDSALEVLDKIK